MMRQRMHRVDSVHPRQDGLNADERQENRPDRHLRRVTRFRQNEYALATIAFLIAGPMIAGLISVLMAVMLTWTGSIDRDRIVAPGSGPVRMVQAAPEHHVYGHG
jgi:hypothetical protein